MKLEARAHLPKGASIPALSFRVRRDFEARGDIPADALPLPELAKGVEFVAAFDDVPKSASDFKMVATAPEPVDKAWEGVLEFERLRKLPAGRLREAFATAVRDNAAQLSGHILYLMFSYKPDLLDDAEVVFPLLVQQVGNPKASMLLDEVLTRDCRGSRALVQ